MRNSRLLVALGAATLTGGAAMAAPYSPVIADAIINPGTPYEVDISGGDTGVSYASYTMSVDWSDSANGPWSQEAFFSLFGGAGQTGTQYVGNTGADNGAANSNSVTLTWGGAFDTAYIGGDSLFFQGNQLYSPTYAAAWSNISLTLNEGVIDAFDLSDTDTVSHAAGQYHMWDLVIDADGTEVQLNTLGSSTTDTGFGVNDTELFLLDTDGVTLLASNDDFDGLRESQIVTFLDAGTYTLVAGTFNIDYDGSAFTTDTTGSGSIVVNASTRPGTGATLNFVGTVPEPGSLALLGLGGLALLRRRRSA